MNYEVLSPWAESEITKTKKGIQPRIDSLEGKTIGLFGFFKMFSTVVLNEIQSLLNEKYQNIEFRLFHYQNEIKVAAEDNEINGDFKKWVNEIDAAIGVFGDGGSSSMFLAKNIASIEKLGKPSVVVAEPACVESCKSGASSQGISGLRIVEMQVNFDLSRKIPFEELGEFLHPYVEKIIPDIIEALTLPLHEDEENPAGNMPPTSGIVCSGDLIEVNDYFYQMGWCMGHTVIPPTVEAVNRMLEGTDLPADYVVALIPPMMGKATIEKIAVNAVMAGCLPVHMPVLIAGIQAMVDPSWRIEGYTCSAAAWFPMWILNGPIRKDLGINTGINLMSPYYRANVSIAHALALITMNIGGVRPVLEDRAKVGTESRMGVCIGEDEENSPWESISEYYGFSKEDSTLTNIWPVTRQRLGRGDEGPVEVLRNICDQIDCVVFDPGAAIILGPNVAKDLANAGLSRTDVMDYIVEYARRPQPMANPQYIIDNNHVNPNGPILSLDPTRSCRKFWSKDHLVLAVAGTGGVTGYAGGGDHGGPVIKKIELPDKWDELILRYRYKELQPPRY